MAHGVASLPSKREWICNPPMKSIPAVVRVPSVAAVL